MCVPAIVEVNHRYSNPDINFLRFITSPLRLLPGFLIIGASKSGTSSLYNYLIRHPNIIPPIKKEVHFFDLNYSKGLYWYRAHFPSIINLKTKRRKNCEEVISGEASPYYIFHPRVPDRVYKAIPQVKLILLLRNPVDRAYSHYHFVVRRGAETRTFKEAIEAEVQTISDEEKKILSNENYHSLTHRQGSYISRGLYVNQLKTWFGLFSKDHIHIICAEDFFADPGNNIDLTFEFLNLCGVKLKKFGVYKKGDYPEMDPATREKLSTFFKPYNRELYQFLGEDFGWDS